MSVWRSKEVASDIILHCIRQKYRRISAICPKFGRYEPSIKNTPLVQFEEDVSFDALLTKLTE